MLTLFIGMKPTGLTVQPDETWPGMWRIHYQGQVSSMVNLTRAKEAAISWVRPKGLGGSEIAYWNRRQTATGHGPVR